MQQFMGKFEQLNGVEATVSLKHYIFDRQDFYCNKLQIVNNEEIIGVILKCQKKYMYKRDVKVVEVQDNKYILSDGRLTITIIVNSL